MASKRYHGADLAWIREKSNGVAWPAFGESRIRMAKVLQCPSFRDSGVCAERFKTFPIGALSPP